MFGFGIEILRTTNNDPESLSLMTNQKTEKESKVVNLQPFLLRLRLWFHLLLRCFFLRLLTTTNCTNFD